MVIHWSVITYCSTRASGLGLAVSSASLFLYGTVDDYLIITDYYSLWPEVYQLRRATSKNTITTMKDVFSRHGIPSELVTDNGSQYKSNIFRKFAKEWGLEHNTSSPRYPQSNGLAEASVKTVKMMMKTLLSFGSTPLLLL